MFSEGIILSAANPSKLGGVFQKKLSVMNQGTFDPVYGGNPITSRRYGQVLAQVGIGQARESGKYGNWNICAGQAFAKVFIPKIFIFSFRLLSLLNLSLQELHFKVGWNNFFLQRWNWNICAGQAFAQVYVPKIFIVLSG